MNDTPEPAQPYRVLARKYRPLDFSGLIGQDAMVQTFANSFKTGRIHHAFILTGVRGVGKTTTARILARAFNYEDENGRRPTLEMEEYGTHCQAIIEGRHVDVIEMDAASNTGIDDIREIIDSVKYAPASAPYKVYIIDEVHMLSKQAFNGLLKTLEEPPPYVKFIFATTEIRKVPVTVLSRCQRFDLRRITPQTMGTYLEDLLGRENITYDAEALGMIIRAGEGSVRDCLSLTDQAIAHGDGRVEAKSVRTMLGLADRGQTIDLFEALMGGDIVRALEIARTLYDAGTDPQVIISDLAQFTHLVTRMKLVKETINDASLTPDERTRGAEFGPRLGIRSLTRAWQILQAGYGEVAQSGNAIQALEMVLIRLGHAADLPTPDELVEKLNRQKTTGASPQSAPTSPGGAGGSQPQAHHGGTGAQGPALATANAAPLTSAMPNAQNVPHAQNAVQEAAQPQNFAELIELAGSKRDLPVKHALENDVRPISFEVGRIEITLTDQADRAIVSLLSTRLKQWTGRNWLISMASEQTREKAPKTIRETREAKKHQLFEAARQDPIVRAVFEAFPDATLENVREINTSPKGQNPAENKTPNSQEKQ